MKIKRAFSTIIIMVLGAFFRAGRGGEVREVHPRGTESNGEQTDLQKACQDELANQNVLQRGRRQGSREPVKT